ncbi:uncharacterized protein I303_102904 [Kwoniella dejecticola CBS 10117]|uniref:Endonuclease/exonuclease/phosphatase n=1 Tax=Kwoniella dejecticola CBS 10117 TaxID=1296121 RepID=A0A1A6AA22_9TREE|nr:endonuclease/exonuclease/phosphatase [Kwoniella dejecticola CBS 10117]OBR86903.1 endonuclease/exonuclease/phosphatase [Kwoniella dejecticola CBS 10117]
MVTRIDPMFLPAHGAASPDVHAQAREREEINLATVNVRYDNGTQSTTPSMIPNPFPANPYREKPWAERKTRLIDCLLSTGDLDIIGFQEVLHSQLLDLRSLLGSNYGHVGVGRDDGQQTGEYSPIFYDQRKFGLVKWGTIWLSPTPERPSKGWDAALPRIATFLTLRRRTASKPRKDTGDGHRGLIHAVNTHYDHLGLKARAQSSLLIRSQIYEWVKKVEREEQVRAEGPVILFGDFNSPPTEEGYRNITSPHALQSNQPSFYFLDSYTHLKRPDGGGDGDGGAAQTRPYGPEHTYTDFVPPGSKNQTRIDFVMLGGEIPTGHSHSESEAEDEGGDQSSGNGIQDANKNTYADRDVHERIQFFRARARGGWKIQNYACIDNFVEGDSAGWTGRWSDHRAVRVSISR